MTGFISESLLFTKNVIRYGHCEPEKVYFLPAYVHTQQSLDADHYPNMLNFLFDDDDIATKCIVLYNYLYQALYI